MKKNAGSSRRADAGDMNSPKTNQDFNNKKPHKADPQMKQVKPEPGRKIPTDLLDDETPDPGDADGNGNLIGNDIQDLWDERDNTRNNPIKKSTKRVKNQDAREL